MKSNIRTILLFMSVVLMISLLSCNPSKKYEKEESAKIQDYLSNNPGLSFELKSSGLYFLEVEAGSGLAPVMNDSAFVRYTAKFLDGTMFDENITEGRPLYGFVVGDNITGFDEGIMLMNQGGKAIFLIPSFLGFGTSGYSFPAYTPLLFDVELILVKPATGK